MEFYVVFDKLSGEVKWRGQGPEGSAAIQVLEDGLATMVVPQEALKGADIDLELIKALATGHVDRAAEAFRLRFVSDGAGQMLTYQYKAAEAAAYLADASASVPFLNAEAEARAMTVVDLASEVTARVALWTVIGSRIEALRMGAKSAIMSATNLAEISTAMAIEWSTVTAA
jgi:hypothetical protein